MTYPVSNGAIPKVVNDWLMENVFLLVNTYENVWFLYLHRGDSGWEFTWDKDTQPTLQDAIEAIAFQK